MKKLHTMTMALLVSALLLLSEAPAATEAVTCSALQLAPCLSAITSGSQPSSACCAKLKEQKPCLCGYLKNPSLRPYVNSPNARKVASTCGVPYPSC